MKIDGKDIDEQTAGDLIRAMARNDNVTIGISGAIIVMSKEQVESLHLKLDYLCIAILFLLVVKFIELVAMAHGMGRI